MPSPASRENGRRLVAILLAIVGVGLAFEVVQQALAQHLEGRTALLFDPGSPSALTQAAEADQTAGRNAAAVATARRALTIQPFDAEALRVVGFALAASRGPNAADPIMTLAGDWSLRDEPTQGWLLLQRLRQHDFNSAFAHADALLRQNDELRTPVFSAFAKLALADPAAIGAMTDRLATGPPWRGAFFDRLTADPANQATAATLALGLATSAHPATRSELSGLFNGLVESGRYLDADRLWRRISVGAAARGQPFDGDFQAPESPEPFGWLISAGQGATADIEVDGDRPGERALHVDYDGFSTPDLAKTFMVLSPGVYRLSGQLRSDAAEGADRLGWVVKCADNGQVLGEVQGPSLLTAGVWRPLSATFTVPAGACAGQWLLLIAHPGERRASVGVWYDKLAITR